MFHILFVIEKTRHIITYHYQLQVSDGLYAVDVTFVYNRPKVTLPDCCRDDLTGKKGLIMTGDQVPCYNYIIILVITCTSTILMKLRGFNVEDNIDFN